MTDFDRWIEEHIPSQTGKTALITGANSGLGFEAAKVLAGKGAAVTLAVRDTAKGEGAAARWRSAPASRPGIRAAAGRVGGA